MNKIYVFVPVAALLAFGAYYWSFSTSYEAELVAKHQTEIAERDAKLKADSENRHKAADAAYEQQKVRKAQREAKEAQDKADEKARQDAVDRRDAANKEQLRLYDKIQIITKDVAALKDSIAKTEEQMKVNQDEQAFLKTYVAKAEENRKNMQDVINKIDAVETAKAKADAEAAKAKKS